jgi:hypothetical protein
VTAYGRRAGWAQCGRRRDVAHSTRAPTFWPCFQLAEAPFDRLKLKNFELKFKFAKYEVVDQITLSNFRKGRPIKISTALEINLLEVADFYGSVKLFSRALTEFLRV